MDKMQQNKEINEQKCRERDNLCEECVKLIIQNKLMRAKHYSKTIFGNKQSAREWS
jgi:hypothetical protein